MNIALDGRCNACVPEQLANLGNVNPSVQARLCEAVAHVEEAHELDVVFGAISDSTPNPAFARKHCFVAFPSTATSFATRPCTPSCAPSIPLSQAPIPVRTLISPAPPAALPCRHQHQPHLLPYAPVSHPAPLSPPPALLYR